MDYIDTIFYSFWSTPTWATLVIIAAIIAAVVTGVNLIGQGKKKWHRNLGLGLALAGTVSMMVCIAAVSVTNIQEDKRSDEARAGVVKTLNSTYGTDITVDELDYYSGLRYPTKKPKTDFAVFGSVERDAEKAGGGFERQTIYLIWQDDELRLAESADGEVFDVLGN